VKVEVLYLADCPNYEAAIHRVRNVMRQLGIQGTVVDVKITHPEMAMAAGFLGSPTIRVNGVDVEPSTAGAMEGGYGCRLYRNGGKPEGVPSAEMIRRAIREAQE
jgi:hypothetical protein